jgi:hypothetical protein
MKKGKEWYVFLNDKEKMKFKANCSDITFNELMEDKYESFRIFISSFFGWVNSLEGWGYWNGISLRQV